MSMMVQDVRNAEASAAAAAASAAVTTAGAGLESPPGISSSGNAAGHMMKFLLLRSLFHKLPCC